MYVEHQYINIWHILFTVRVQHYKQTCKTEPERCFSRTNNEP